MKKNKKTKRYKFKKKKLVKIINYIGIPYTKAGQKFCNIFICVGLHYIYVTEAFQAVVVGVLTHTLVDSLCFKSRTDEYATF